MEDKSTQAQMDRLNEPLIALKGYEIINGRVNHLRPGLKDLKLINDPNYIRLVGFAEYQAKSQVNNLQRLPPYMKDLIDMIEEEIRN